MTGNRFLFGWMVTGWICIQCASPSGAQADTADPVVSHAGALKQIMHQNDLSANADLRDLAEVPHLYALGAVEDLKGEILILDGQPFISKPDGDDVVIDSTFGHMATLLVWASVERWSPHAVPDSIDTYARLEYWLDALAVREGFDLKHPFPFRIRTPADRLRWHVIDWPEGDVRHSHEKHMIAGPHGLLSDAEVEILGFYSRHHHAVFTHHSTNMHLHFRTTDGRLSGHVDDLQPGPGSVVYLPG